MYSGRHFYLVAERQAGHSLLDSEDVVVYRIEVELRRGVGHRPERQRRVVEPAEIARPGRLVAVGFKRKRVHFQVITPLPGRAIF